MHSWHLQPVLVMPVTLTVSTGNGEILKLILVILVILTIPTVSTGNGGNNYI